MKTLEKSHFKTLFHKYKHGLVFTYFIIYIIWFLWLEKSVTTNYTVVSIGLDHFIPFKEIFVIPYLLWFVYVASFVLYFFFTSKTDFYKCTAFLFTGMTICLIIYTIWPNGQDLRPVVFENNNILTDMVKAIYLADTPTNVCPSIHVFNSIGIHVAVVNSNSIKNMKWVRAVSFLLSTSICLSTVFIKQHSVFDGICAMILAAAVYLIVYLPDYNRIFKRNTAGSHLLKED